MICGGFLKTLKPSKEEMMLKKVSITLLFTVLFALVAWFGNSQVWAAPCNQVLSPTTQVVETEDGIMKFTSDPCTGQLISVEICDSQGQNCRPANWDAGQWCINDVCRSWTAVVPSTFSLPAAYSNIRCYYGGRV